MRGEEDSRLPAELPPPTRTISRPSHSVASIVVAQYETAGCLEAVEMFISGRR